MFVHMYIRAMVLPLESAAGSSTELPDASIVPSELTLDFVDSAILILQGMLRGQGPIGSDLDDPAVWRPGSDGPHTDETARLFHHGVYSSNHLRALKQQAELCYWRWRYLRRQVADAKLAALVNRKFVHVVRHIMPGRGWLADIEYGRVCEVEETLNTSFYSSGLNKQSPAMTAAPAKSGGASPKSGSATTGPKITELPVEGPPSSSGGTSGGGDGGGGGGGTGTVTKKKKGKKKK